MRLQLALAALLCVAVYTLGLGNLPLQVHDEPREVEIARELRENGLLSASRLNGGYHVVKPPLVHWLMTPVFALFPDRPVPPEWAFRLVPALFTLGMLLTVFLLGRGWFSTRHGALAALLAATMPVLVVNGRRILTDPALACLVTVAVGSSLTALRAVRGRRFLAFLGCVAAGLFLGFLAKGPVAAIVSGLAVGTAIIADRGFRGLVTLRALVIASVALVAVGAAGGLYLWILHRDGGPELVRSYLAYHTGGLSGASGTHVKGWLFYFGRSAEDFLPWMLFVPFAGIGRRHGLAPGGHPEFPLRLLVAWAAAPFVLFTVLAQKRELYLLPLVAPLALLAAETILEPPPLGTRAGRAVRTMWTVLSGIAFAAMTVGPLGLAGWCAYAGYTAGTVAGFLLAVAGIAVIALARREPAESEAPLPYPFATAAGVAIAATALLLCVEPLSSRAWDRTIQPLARQVKVAVESEPGTTLYGYGLGETIDSAVPLEMGRTFPSLRTPEEVRAKLASEPRARVLVRLRDYLADLPDAGRIVGEFANPRNSKGESREELVIVGPRSR